MPSQPPSPGFLIACLSGIYQLAQRVDAVETRHTQERYLKRMLRVVEAHGGRLLEPAVERINAEFGDASTVLGAALGIRERVRDLPPASGMKLGVHVAADLCVYGEPARARRIGVLVDAARQHGVVMSGGLVAAMGERRWSATSLDVDHGILPDGAFEIGPELQSAVLAAPHVVTAPPSYQLRLRYRDDERVLEDGADALTLGRDPANAVVLPDARASRYHAVIEFRDGEFVLRDRSSNGTFIRQRNGGAILLHQEQMVLRGAGEIGFGHDLSDATLEAMSYVREETERQA